MTEEIPDGYTVPVYRALTKPVLVAGVPKPVAVALGMAAALAAAVVLIKPGIATGVPALLIEAAIYGVHQFAVGRCKSDPHYFEVYFQNRGPGRLIP